MKTTALDFTCRLRLAIVIAMPFLPSVACAEAEGEDAAPIGIAAKVNGHVITKNEVSLLLTPKFQILVERFPDRGAEFEKLVVEAKKGVIQELGDRRIMIEQFDHLGIQIAPERIEEEIQREIRDTYQGNVTQLRDALKVSRMTMEGFRLLLRERLLESEIKKQLPQEK